MGCPSSKSNDLSVHARIDSSGFFRLKWESEVDEIFEAVKESRERSAEQLEMGVRKQGEKEPQDYDVRQYGRVLELRNSDLLLRPTDLS